MTKKKRRGRSSSKRASSERSTKAKASSSTGVSSVSAQKARAALHLANPIEHRRMYDHEIQNMMYTFGDVRQIDRDTLDLVSDIVRTETMALIKAAVDGAVARGSRYLYVEDVVFQIRRDANKLHRLLEFLSWKDVRKNADKAEKAEDVEMDDDGDDEAAAKPAAPTRSVLKMPWDLPHTLQDVCGNVAEVEDADLELLEGTKNLKLKIANDKTVSMSFEQYQVYSEARQASFTYKKNKKFREWLQLSVLDLKPNDDILEILGFLALDLVTELTLTAIFVQSTMEKFGAELRPLTDLPKDLTAGVIESPNAPAATSNDVPKPVGIEGDTSNSFTVLHMREAARRLHVITGKVYPRRRRPILHM